MRRAAGAIVAAALLCAGAAPAGAVVGGTAVPDGQLRYVANIAIGGAFGCTGTLIAPDWVMTAGHCGSLTGSLTAGAVPSPIGLPASSYDVKLGSVHADGTGAEDHSVTQVVVDSDYLVTNGAGNDVTLLQLDHPSAIAPVKIAAAGERAIWAPGTKATIAGFGLTSENAQDAPPTMMRAQVPIQSDADCAKAYPNGLGGTAARRLVRRAHDAVRRLSAGRHGHVPGRLRRPAAGDRAGWRAAAGRRDELRRRLRAGRRAGCLRARGRGPDPHVRRALRAGRVRARAGCVRAEGQEAQAQAQAPPQAPPRTTGTTTTAVTRVRPMAEREHDIVLFGATGFTGALTAEYLAGHAGDGLRWALAGRNRAKLEALSRAARACDVPLLHADVTDEASLRAVAESARVVITTVGPYVTYGEPLVAACAAAGTDYVDLTGEPEFVDRMYVAPPRGGGAHGRADRPRLRLRLDPARPRRPVHRRAAARGRAAERARLRARGRQAVGRHVPLGDDRVLARAPDAAGAQGAPAGSSGATTARRVRLEAKPHRELGYWAVPMPTIDPQVIARSARALDRYGPDFTYGHYAGVKRLPVAVGGVAGVASLFAAAQVPPVRKLLLGRLSPGDGPSRGRAREGLVQGALRRRGRRASAW